jgi:carbamoyltransferase
MNVLGINAYHGDASAAILINGQLAAFAAEERFNRIKHCAGFPTEAVRYCLHVAGLSIQQLDAVTTSKDPGANRFAKALHVLRHPAILSPTFLRSRLSQSKRVRDVGALLAETLGQEAGQEEPEVLHIEHHLTHAASAFLASPFDRAAILTLDGMGDAASAMMAIGEGNSIRVLKRVYFPHSLGFLYTAVSQHLGFEQYGDEGKVMGLAAYGQPNFLKEMRQLIHPTRDGRYELDLRYFVHQNGGVAEVWVKEPHYGRLFSSRVNDLFGEPRVPKSELATRHKDLARSLQEITEEIFFHALRQLQRETGESRLCFAGGVALNCVMNGKIERQTPFREVYIQPDAGDGGTALGGALYHTFCGSESSLRRVPMDHVYWGPSSSDSEIEAALRENGLAVQTDPVVASRAARAIADGKVVGWFQGRMEVGPRALGNRSILADPRRVDMKDILNARIKHRESFRPFAPSVLAEKCGDWFEGPADSPFMLMNYIVRTERRSQVPAITHADGTARVQTVHRDTNPRYWELISEFEKISGVPVVVNTSFNDDEPIVCRPGEAIQCFLRTRMDVLILGDYWVEKAS